MRVRVGVEGDIRENILYFLYYHPHLHPLRLERTYYIFSNINPHMRVYMRVGVVVILDKIQYVFSNIMPHPPHSYPHMRVQAGDEIRENILFFL
jgi:hypothetical protein